MVDVPVPARPFSQKTRRSRSISQRTSFLVPLRHPRLFPAVLVMYACYSKNRSSLSDSPSLWFSFKSNTGRSRTAVSSCSCSSAIFSLVSSGLNTSPCPERSATTSGTFCVAPRYDEPRRHPRISASDYGRRIRDGRAVKRKLKRTECLVCDVIIGEHFERPR